VALHALAAAGLLSRGIVPALTLSAKAAPAATAMVGTAIQRVALPASAL
jgi:hypothetical protein